MNTLISGPTPTQLLRRAELRAHATAYELAWKAHATFSRSGSSSATPEQLRRIERDTPGGEFTNELRSELELLDFVAEPPAVYFGYPSADGQWITNFMGTHLARITSKGPLYRGGFQGNYRQTFRAKGLNGLTYYGTIYGGYARMRSIRGKK